MYSILPALKNYKQQQKLAFHEKFGPVSNQQITFISNGSFLDLALKNFFCHCRYRWAVPPETFSKKIRPRLCFRSQVGDISILIFVHRKVRVLKQYPPKKFSWKCRHGSEYANGLWRAKLKGAELSFTRPHDTNVILVHGKAAAIGTTSKGRAFLGVKSFSFLQKDEFFEIFCFQSSR